jgi:hypothetical protein
MWSSRAASAASYTVAGSELRLTIPPEHGLWCPGEHDPMRVRASVRSLLRGGREHDRTAAPVRVPLDVSEFHVYTADWQPGRVDFFIDGEHRKTVRQAPDYAMQMMIAVFVRGG